MIRKIFRSRAGSNSTKQTVYKILVMSLMIGLPLMILDGISKQKVEFMVPERFETMIVDLSDQNRVNELLFEREIDVPTGIEFFIQSDTASEKTVKVVSESEILGTNRHEINMVVGKVTGTASTAVSFIMDAGKYSVYLTNEKMEGKIAIGYQENPTKLSEFERLLKIHQGELNNPPAGYKEIYATELTGRSCQGETFYTLSLTEPTNIGISVYTSANQGDVSVDLIGSSSSYYGLAHPQSSRICDQLEATLPAGEYLFKLNCNNADGQVYVFLKP